MREEAHGGRRHSKMFAASASVLLLLLSILCATTAGADSAGSTASGGGIRSSTSRRAAGEGPMVEIYGPAEGHRASADGTSPASGASKGERVPVVAILLWALPQNTDIPGLG